MKNVFITGSGRSGTSMLAGMFAKAGYFLGDRLYPSREANPKGFFEDEEINALNEEIITYSIGTAFGDQDAGRLLARYKRGHLWLARFPMEHDFVCSDEQRATIGSFVDRRPFCFKDPRFCFTLENWIAAVPDSLVLCMFREPALAVESILKECRTAAYLFNFSTSVEELFAVWREIYWRMLRLYLRHSTIRFVYYNEIISGTAIEPLEELAGAKLDRSFPEASLNRTFSTLKADELSLLVFEALMNLGREDLGENRDITRLNLVREVDDRLSEAGLDLNAGRAAEVSVRELLTSTSQRSATISPPGVQSALVPKAQETQGEEDGRPGEATEATGALRTLLSRYGELFQRLRKTVAEQEEGLAGLRTEVVRRDEELADLKAELCRRDEEVAGLRSDLEKREREIAALYASSSRQTTRPFRLLRRLCLAMSAIASDYIRKWATRNR
jgi:hypothetical protein